MEKGTIIEYIDHEKLICALVVDTALTGGKRLRLLTENNREINLPERRVTHAGGWLDPDAGRAGLADQLKQISRRRTDLAATLVVADLWEVLVDEPQWINLDTMTALCFPDADGPDHEAAVIRALFADRLYFKFDHNQFLPHTAEQVQAIKIRRDKEVRRKWIITEGAKWLKSAIDKERPKVPENGRDIIETLQRYYIFEKDASEAALARAMLAGAGNISPDRIFPLMVRLGQWDKDENIDLFRYEIPLTWPDGTDQQVAAISSAVEKMVDKEKRRDLTSLSMFTIDGSATFDFDDALSLEAADDGSCRVGIHISDVAAWLRPGDTLDKEALTRGSSIYMADRKIPMLPPELSEGRCSLRAGEPRPAISTLITFSSTADVLACEVVPSVVCVDCHLTYNDVDRDLNFPDQPGQPPHVLQLAQSDQLQQLHALAAMLREKRAQAGALTIAIPELDVRIDAGGQVTLAMVDRYSRARSTVEEMMIVSNWAVARFLVDREVPALYRSQAEPKQRLVKKEDAPGTLFQNWVQRKMLSRVRVDRKPERHAGLGLDVYTTATSPIRKYLDLIAQRQIRAALGLGRPYTEEALDTLIQRLGPVLTHVGRVQQGRQRYWVLKHLEKKVGEKVEGIVLDKFKNDYSVLLPDYLLECRMSRSPGANLKPNDQVQLTLQHVNARNNLVSVFYG